MLPRTESKKQAASYEGVREEAHTPNNATGGYVLSRQMKQTLSVYVLFFLQLNKGGLTTPVMTIKSSKLN